MVSVGFGGSRCTVLGFIGWLLPPLSNSWIILKIWLYIALNRTPNIDCYWQYPIYRVQGLGFGASGLGLWVGGSGFRDWGFGSKGSGPVGIPEVMEEWKRTYRNYHSIRV